VPEKRKVTGSTPVPTTSVCARARLDSRTRFHDMRHTAAALMIAEGAHLLAVKERLGHSTIQVTADRYGHLFPSLEAA
jgi:integrase